MEPQFYKDRICLNVLANSVGNAKEIAAAAEGHVVVGLLSKNYPSVDAAVADMKIYAEQIDGAISVGLGAGDPNQSQMVADISAQLDPPHMNQVFTGVGITRALKGDKAGVINTLVSPCGKPGYVNIATGPLSSKSEPAIVPIETAIALIKDMGGQAVKYFPMRGLETRDEYLEVAKACAKADFVLEPTGGIDLDNFKEILQIAVDAGVKKIIPHVYTSIIDKTTGNTNIKDVETLYTMMKELV